MAAAKKSFMNEHLKRARERRASLSRQVWSREILRIGYRKEEEVGETQLDLEGPELGTCSRKNNHDDRKDNKSVSLINLEGPEMGTRSSRNNHDDRKDNNKSVSLITLIVGWLIGCLHGLWMKLQILKSDLKKSFLKSDLKKSFEMLLTRHIRPNSPIQASFAECGVPRRLNLEDINRLGWEYNYWYSESKLGQHFMRQRLKMEQMARVSSHIWCREMGVGYRLYPRKKEEVGETQQLDLEVGTHNRNHGNVKREPLPSFLRDSHIGWEYKKQLLEKERAKRTPTKSVALSNEDASVSVGQSTKPIRCFGLKECHECLLRRKKYLHDVSLKIASWYLEPFRACRLCSSCTEDMDKQPGSLTQKKALDGIVWSKPLRSRMSNVLKRDILAGGPEKEVNADLSKKAVRSSVRNNYLLEFAPPPSSKRRITGKESVLWVHQQQGIICLPNAAGRVSYRAEPESFSRLWGDWSCFLDPVHEITGEKSKVVLMDIRYCGVQILTLGLKMSDGRTKEHSDFGFDDAFECSLRGRRPFVLTSSAVKKSFLYGPAGGAGSKTALITSSKSGHTFKCPSCFRVNPSNQGGRRKGLPKSFYQSLPIKVLDGMNSLVEHSGSITVNEYGTLEGKPIVIRPHPQLRMFRTVNPTYGEVSRATRNKGVEICLSQPATRSRGVEICLSQPYGSIGSTDDENELKDVKRFLALSNIPYEVLVNVMTKTHLEVKKLGLQHDVSISDLELMRWFELFQRHLTNGNQALWSMKISFEHTYLSSLGHFVGNDIINEVVGSYLSINGLGSSLCLPGGWPTTLTVCDSDETPVKQYVEDLGAQMVQRFQVALGRMTRQFIPLQDSLRDWQEKNVEDRSSVKLLIFDASFPTYIAEDDMNMVVTLVKESSRNNNKDEKVRIHAWISIVDLRCACDRVDISQTVIKGAFQFLFPLFLFVWCTLRAMYDSSVGMGIELLILLNFYLRNPLSS
ncbi:hypothetical protein SSX86_021320 [Deinandra increscens subsp. villosa]|uniref:Uncharacterized protein n=1 Tax=Deinandra increscens subsp. villosa TaxID=3103831 RepID=A0AAP0GU77_9ASTR